MGGRGSLAFRAVSLDWVCGLCGFFVGAGVGERAEIDVKLGEGGEGYARRESDVRNLSR